MVKEADKKQIAQIYDTYLVNDFPKSEVKPLKKILDGVDCGKYFVCVYYGEEQADFEMQDFKAYAFFIKSSVSNAYLLDYFAVLEGSRSSGIGSAFLQELKQMVKKMGGHLILEVENPDYEQEGAQKDYMLKRIGFYQKNGINVSGVSCEFCGNQYKLLYGGQPTSDEVIRKETEELYLDFFGQDFIEKNCRFN